MANETAVNEQEIARGGEAYKNGMSNFIFSSSTFYFAPLTLLRQKFQ